MGGFGYRLCMVRYIERAQVFLSSSEFYLRANARPSGPLSFVVDVNWGRMGKRRGVDVVTQLCTHQLSPGESLDDRGYWLDTSFYFVLRDPAIPLSFYFRELSHEFTHIHEFGHAGLYDEAVMDVEFAHCLGVNSPPAPLREGVDPDVLQNVFRGVFNIGPEYEWRLPEPHERIYHRPEGVYLGVSLEHLRGGWRPRMHQFVKNLFKYQFGVSMLQFSPNSIRWVNWFMGVCHKQNLLPTFKLFHLLFRVQRSTLHPLFELHFAGERFGFGKGSPKPVVNLTSLKGWHQEIIFIKGGDLAFTPIFSKTITIRSPEVPVLEGPALKKVQDFCKGLGEGLQLTRDSLMKNGFLLGLGCKC